MRVYRRSGLRIKPLVGAILAHPALYRHLDAPTMVKSPVVFVAGSLRTAGQGIERDAWTWLLEGMGQYPFHPPSVAGWDWGASWLSSNSMRVRFDFANYMIDTPRVGVKDGSTPTRCRRKPRGRARAPRRRRAVDLAAAPTASCCAIAQRVLADEEREESADMCQRILRHLLISGPDAQVH